MISGRTRHARSLHVEHEEANPLVLGRIRVGAGEQEDPVGAVAAGGPDLLAVDDEVVAVAYGAGLQRGEVAARARLRVTLAPDRLGAGDAGQVLALLLLAAVHDQRRSQHAHAETARAVIGRAVVAELFAEHHLLVDARAQAAVLLRPGGGDPAARRELLVEGVRLIEIIAAGNIKVEAALKRRQRCLQEGAHLAAQLILGRAETKVHRCPSWLHSHCWVQITRHRRHLVPASGG